MDQDRRQQMPGRHPPAVEISLVVPMHNEAEAIGAFFDTVMPVLDGMAIDYEIVCVNDGSRDETLERLKTAREANKRIKIIDLSRNFGKELALTAGLEHASGAAVIPIDADLQDPPEVIPKLVAKWREGYDMVLAQRQDRSSDTLFKRVSARLFYRLIGRLSEVPIPHDVGDFRLLDRRVVEALASLPERTRFMKGIFAWLGFKQVTITYARDARTAGESSWRVWSLWNFAIEGITSFSSFPLRIWSYVGTACAIVAAGYMVYIIARTLIYGVEVPGYASLLSVVLLFNGLTMVSLGILGEYVARMFVEVKRRPLYLVRDSWGFCEREDDQVETIPADRQPAKRHTAP
jgi:glycosyltransferase involved in cell wall biosynthesis